MADNSIPKDYDSVVEHLEDAADGAATHGAAIGLSHYTEAVLRLLLWALIGKPAGPNGVPPAVPGAKSLWDDAKANKTAKSAAVRIACSNGRALVLACMGVLKPRLGQHWNSTWQTAGFLGGSLEVPTNPMTLLHQFRAYFANHPTHEAPTLEPYAVTAAACEAAAQAISTAQSASNQSNTDAGTAQKNYLDALAAARAGLSGLRDELSHLIAEDDPRWYAFGFDRPCDPARPPTPENLRITLGAIGSRLLILQWVTARRATGYRVRVALAADGTFLAEVLTEDNAAVVENLPAGAEVIVTVAARNATGESRECEGMRVRVP